MSPADGVVSSVGGWGSVVDVVEVEVVVSGGGGASVVMGACGVVVSDPTVESALEQPVRRTARTTTILRIWCM